VGQPLFIYDFSRTAVAILTRLGINHPWERKYKSIQMKGKTTIQMMIIAKQKYTLKIYGKKTYPEPVGQFQPNLVQIIKMITKCKTGLVESI
jgi:hypothetical protein